MDLRYADLFRGKLLRTIAPRIAHLLREPVDPVDTAFDATVRVLAAMAAERAASPFGTAELMRAVTESPYDAGAAPVEFLDCGEARVAGAPVGDGSAWAIRCFGLEPLARLASAIASAVPVSTSSAARLPSIATPLLLAALRHEVAVHRLDAAGLAALLIATNPFATAGVACQHIAHGAGVSLRSSSAFPPPPPA